MRTENRCKFLVSFEEGAQIVCDGKNECPKNRNRWIITTACWRIREKK